MNTEEIYWYLLKRNEWKKNDRVTFIENKLVKKIREKLNGIY